MQVSLLCGNTRDTEHTRTQLEGLALNNEWVLFDL